jgi:hypothetical protein
VDGELPDTAHESRKSKKPRKTQAVAKEVVQVVATQVPEKVWREPEDAEEKHG